MCVLLPTVLQASCTRVLGWLYIFVVVLFLSERSLLVLPISCFHNINVVLLWFRLGYNTCGGTTSPVPMDISKTEDDDMSMYDVLYK